MPGVNKVQNSTQINYCKLTNNNESLKNFMRKPLYDFSQAKKSGIPFKQYNKEIDASVSAYREKSERAKKEQELELERQKAADAIIAYNNLKF